MTYSLGWLLAQQVQGAPYHLCQKFSQYKSLQKSQIVPERSGVDMGG